VHHLISIINDQINNPPLNIENINPHISFGIGVVIGEKSDLLRKANLALIRAKKSGPGSFVIYQHEFDISGEYKKNIEWMKNIQAALEKDMIIPFFQGIRDNRTGLINKYECLIRIKTETEIITPQYFLEPARQAGLLPKLTERMLDKSFSFFKNANFDFSINICKEDLERDKFCSIVDEKTSKYGIDPKRVTFEILESESIEKYAGISDELKCLKNMGFKLAIDDFGIAYSNFARLVELNIDYLKIDGSFIKNIDTNKKSYEITKSITGFCHNLDIMAVAEFVHSTTIQKIVEELGVDYYQGYFFSVPKDSLIS
jgi:EAL domain-containing protein (putative c-di-GMP-specific phosphodiesterase class I)